MFQANGKQATKDINFGGQKTDPIKQAKYLGVYLDEHLSWSFHLNQLKSKLSRARGLLAKLRNYLNYVNTPALRTVYRTL